MVTRTWYPLGVVAQLILQNGVQEHKLLDFPHHAEHEHGRGLVFARGVYETVNRPHAAGSVTSRSCPAPRRAVGGAPSEILGGARRGVGGGVRGVGGRGGDRGFPRFARGGELEKGKERPRRL